MILVRIAAFWMVRHLFPRVDVYKIMALAVHSFWFMGRRTSRGEMRVSCTNF